MLDGSWDKGFPNFSDRHHKVPRKEVPFFHQISSLLPSPRRCSPMILEPGNYELSFEICIPRQMPETIEGVDDSFIRYILQAQIYGNSGDNLTISREIRLRKAYTMSLLREPSVSYYILRILNILYFSRLT